MKKPLTILLFISFFLLHSQSKIFAQSIGETLSNLSSTEWSPFEGIKVRGLPVFTMVMGEIVAENREIVGRRAGCFVPVKR